jgi:hypothetical protein
MTGYQNPTDGADARAVLQFELAHRAKKPAAVPLEHDPRQSLLPGTPRRQMAKGKIATTTPQAEDPGPLFTQTPQAPSLPLDPKVHGLQAFLDSVARMHGTIIAEGKLP